MLTDLNIEVDSASASNRLTAAQVEAGATSVVGVTNSGTLVNGVGTPVSGGSSLPSSAAWSTTWDTASYTDLGTHTVVAALALSSADGGSVVGGCTQATLIADGVTVPTLDGIAATAYGYTNTNSAANLVQLFRASGYKYWSVLPYVGAVISGGASAPGAPTGLVTGAVTSSSIALTWSAPASNGGAAITSYSIQYSTDGGGSWATWGTSGATTASVTGLTDGVVYWFKVAATNSAGTGSYSSTAYSGTTALDFIRFSSLTLHTESGADPYTYTASSGSTTSNSYAGNSNLSLAANASGWFDAGLVVTNSSAFGGAGFKTANTAGAYNTFLYFMYQSTMTSYIVQKNAVNQTKTGPDASLTPVSGDVLRLKRIGSDVIFQVVRGGTVYTLHTLSGETTPTLYPGITNAAPALAIQMAAHVGLA